MIGQLLSLTLVVTSAADSGVKPTVHTGHYMKKTAGVSGDDVYLTFTDFPAFDQVLGAIPQIGPRKPNPVTADTFQEFDVIVVLKRGQSQAIITEVSATSDGGTLTVAFKTDVRPSGSASFATPLVLTVPKGLTKSVRYVENGKPVGR